MTAGQLSQLPECIRRPLTSEQRALAVELISRWRAKTEEERVTTWVINAKAYWATIDADEWITEARRHFSPGVRQPCVICKRYRSITQAHHVTPLSLQLSRGYVEPDQKFVWLCPTHHTAVHVLFSSVKRASVEEIGRSAASLINDLAGQTDELRALLDLYRLGAGEQR